MRDTHTGGGDNRPIIGQIRLRSRLEGMSLSLPLHLVHHSHAGSNVITSAKNHEWQGTKNPKHPAGD